MYKLQKSIILTERLISESQSVKLSQFLLLTTTIFTPSILVSQNSFSHIEIPAQFSKFQNFKMMNMGLGIEYPSNLKLPSLNHPKTLSKY